MGGNAVGSIRTRKSSGFLFFDFRFKGVRCREQTLLHETAANRKKLEAILHRIERDIAQGVFSYRDYFPDSKLAIQFDAIHSAESNITELPQGSFPFFKDFAELWYEENEIRWKDSYKTIIAGTLKKYLLPEFGEVLIHSIKKAHILKLRAALANGKHPACENRQLSNDRINHIMTPLRMILDDASDRYGFNSEFKGIKTLKAESTDVEPFTLDEVQKILTHVRPDFKDYYLIRFFTGLRTGEIDGLKWQYVDLDKRQILVRETVVQGKITTTKTPESRREISMSEPVYQAFCRLKAEAKNSLFVFSNRAGNPLEHRNVTQRVWYPLLKNLDIKARKPYQTRHTAATLWLAAGESPEWIARQMGHTTTRMLFTVYSRYVPNLTRQDGSAMDRLLSNKF